jgi:hypothetical protein
MILQSGSLRKRDARARQITGANCNSAIISTVGTLTRFTAKLFIYGICVVSRMGRMTVDY